MVPPPLNPDIHDFADVAKRTYYEITQEIAALQYRLAELAGTGRVSRSDSVHLQYQLVRMWEALYFATVCTVRDSDTPDWTWNEDDNTYSDGRRILHQVRIEAREESVSSWEHNRFLFGAGAVNEYPRGTISYIAPVIATEPVEEPTPPAETSSAESLRERLDRYRHD
jgi:hypothetical protein